MREIFGPIGRLYPVRTKEMLNSFGHFFVQVKEIIKSKFLSFSFLCPLLFNNNYFKTVLFGEL